MSNQLFQSPSGNIQCEVLYGYDRNGRAVCTIQHSTCAVPDTPFHSL